MNKNDISHEYVFFSGKFLGFLLRKYETSYENYGFWTMLVRSGHYRLARLRHAAVRWLSYLDFRFNLDGGASIQGGG